MTEPGYETDLRRRVGPEMYQRNSFRVTGLEVAASARAVRRCAEEARGDEWITEACRQLGDPMRRIIDEFFWHWPGDDTHNRAVDAHAKALADPTDDVDWVGVRLCWQEAAREEAGWDYMRERILQLDEPEIRPDFVDQLRRLLPGLLVSINTALFTRAVERADDAAAAAQVRAAVLMASGDERLAGVEIATAIRPVLDDIRRRTAAARDEVTADHRRGLVVAQDLIARAERLVRIIGNAPGRAPLAPLCDEVAAAARVCIVVYGNETADARSCAQLLARARSLTDNVVTVRDIDSDSSAFLSNELGAICRRMCAPGGPRPDFALRDVATLVDSAEDVLDLLAAIAGMPQEVLHKSRDDIALAVVAAVSVRLATMCDSQRVAALLRRAQALATTDNTRVLVDAARLAATVGHRVRQLCWFCGQLGSPESTVRVRLVRTRPATEQKVVDIERCRSCHQEWNRLFRVLDVMIVIGPMMLLVLAIVLPLLGLLGVVGSGWYILALGTYLVIYAGTWRIRGRVRRIDARMREHPVVAGELADPRVRVTMDVRQ